MKPNSPNYQSSFKNIMKMSMVFKINLYPSIEKQERRMLGDTTEFQLRFIYFVLVVLKTEKKLRDSTDNTNIYIRKTRALLKLIIH